MFSILGTQEYADWYQVQPFKIQGLIHARLERIKEHGHFGDAKHISSRLSELRWKNGLRIYFSISIKENYKSIVLLIGGTKSSQKSDIAKAKKLILQLNKV